MHVVKDRLSKFLKRVQALMQITCTDDNKFLVNLREANFIHKNDKSLFGLFQSVVSIIEFFDFSHTTLIP